MNTNETPAHEIPQSVPSATPPPLPSPDLTTSSNAEASATTPPPNTPRPLTEQEKKDMKGCAKIVAVPLGLIVLWFISRDLLLWLAFFAVAGGISFAGIKAKKSKLLSIGGGLLLGFLTLVILEVVVPERGIVSKSDLKNPKVALEKLGWKAFPNVPKTESVEVLEIPYTGGRHKLSVTFHADTMLSDKGTLQVIRNEMEKAYRNVLKYRELEPEFVEFTAQIELQDRYGNNNGWNDVYRTVMTREAIERLNRDRLDAVNFADIWKVTYVHPIFSDYANEDY